MMFLVRFHDIRGDGPVFRKRETFDGIHVWTTLESELAHETGYLGWVRQFLERVLRVPYAPIV